MNTDYNLKRMLEDAPSMHENRPLTCIPSDLDPRDYKYQNLLISAGSYQAGAAAIIDYRPNLPPVFDQGQRGSCVACAAAWTVKAFHELNQGDFPGQGLSAAFLYSLCKKNDGIPGQEGTTPKIAMQMLQKYGICPEVTMPYSTLANLPAPQVPEASVAVINTAAVYKIKTYAQLCCNSDISRSATIQAMRTALKNEGPFMVALLVCDNFIPDGKGKLPLPAGMIRGGHAVGIVGDLPDQGCFILRNSWGNYWGLNGYALLPYEWITARYDGGWYLFEAWTATDITVPKAAQRIEITPGLMTMLVDGQQVALDQPAIVSRNRLLLPLRAVSGNLGYVVTWDGCRAILTRPN